VVICAGACYRQQVAGADVAWQFDVAGDFVAGFAVVADHGDGSSGSRGVAVSKDRSVFRAATRDARVVAHAAVNRDERAPARLGFRGQYPVEGDALRER
jgi:hypothetical protein